MPITEPLRAARNRDFAPTLWVQYFGSALPSGTVTMEVRQYGGQAGAPLAQDASVAVLSDTLIDQRKNPATGQMGDFRVLELAPLINRAQLAAMPGIHQPEAGDAQRFEQEIKITYADGGADTLWIGAFILEPGVNTA